MNILLPFLLLLTVNARNPELKGNPAGTILPHDTTSPSHTPNPIPLKKDTSLVLYYNAIACPCAQWTEDREGFPDSTTQFYYLEPASKKLVSAESLWDGRSLPLAILVKGQIVSYSGLPTGYRTKGRPEPANVFRYTTIKVVKKGHPIR